MVAAWEMKRYRRLLGPAGFLDWRLLRLLVGCSGDAVELSFSCLFSGDFLFRSCRGKLFSSILLDENCNVVSHVAECHPMQSGIMKFPSVIFCMTEDLFLSSLCACSRLEELQLVFVIRTLDKMPCLSCCRERKVCLLRGHTSVK